MEDNVESAYGDPMFMKELTLLPKCGLDTKRIQQ